MIYSSEKTTPQNLGENRMIVQFEITRRFDNSSFDRNFTASVDMIIEMAPLPEWFCSNEYLFGEKMYRNWGNRTEQSYKKTNVFRALTLTELNEEIDEAIDEALELIKRVKEENLAQIDLIVPFEKITHHI
jgi:hypothetical protein